jgi:hypothetical protein
MIPQQIDVSIPINVAAVEVGEKLQWSLETMFVGSFIANFFVSVSMKKLMEATRVLQIISFFILIKISYSPVSFVFMTKIYEFGIFKIIPESAIAWALIQTGLKQPYGTQLVIEINGEERDKQPRSAINEQIISMNILGLGAAFLLVSAVLVSILLFLLRRCPRVKTSFKKKYVPLIYNAVHASFKTAILPLLIVQLSLAKNMNDSGDPVGMKAYYLPSAILAAAIFYPLGMHIFLNRNYQALVDNDSEFSNKHKEAYENILTSTNESKLGFVLVTHFRRLIYALVIVFMVPVPSL